MTFYNNSWDRICHHCCNNSNWQITPPLSLLFSCWDNLLYICTQQLGCFHSAMAKRLSSQTAWTQLSRDRNIEILFDFYGGNFWIWGQKLPFCLRFAWISSVKGRHIRATYLTQFNDQHSWSTTSFLRFMTSSLLSPRLIVLFSFPGMLVTEPQLELSSLPLKICYYAYCPTPPLR